MVNFTSLPPEITREIIKLVLEGWPGGASVCASVSRQWQYLVERKNFAFLVLNRSRLESSQKIMTPARQAFVRLLHLELELPEEKMNASLEEHDLEGQLLTGAVIEFFKVLSSWRLPPADYSQRSGVDLIIHIYSPRTTSLWHSPETALVCKNALSAIPESASSQIPELPWVGSFTLLSRGGIALVDLRTIDPISCSIIASRLPNIHEASLTMHESEDLDTFTRQLRRELFARYIDNLPQSLRHLNIDYESYQSPWHYLQDACPQLYTVKHEADPLSTALGAVSQRLETLEIHSGLSVDSSVFWPAPSLPSSINDSALYWPRLRSICIQASIISPSGAFLFQAETAETAVQLLPEPRLVRLPGCFFRSAPDDKYMNEYSLAAARAAAHMPKLRHLETYWCEWKITEIRCSITYDNPKGSSAPTLRCVSDPLLNLTDEVKDAWQAVARAHRGEGTVLELHLEQDGELKKNRDFMRENGLFQTGSLRNSS
ncbi:hypothetical protein F5Y16DRAFT_35340 [Xylariaceae sp. FL0255]|nr:hypothetical protein F5Y16DRAFT_35340 [Xylariaceae sp. FL0255]